MQRGRSASGSGGSERLAVFVLVAALSLLGLGAGSLVADTLPAHGLALAVGVAALAAAALALPRAGGRRGRLLGAAGGVLYGASDAATKAVTMTHGGLIAALTSPWLVIVVLLCVAAFACFQRGLQIGPAVPVIAMMTAATNGVAIAIGLLVFGEPLGAAPAFADMHLVAFALAVAAGVTLVRAQGRLAQPGRGDNRAGTPSHGWSISARLGADGRRRRAAAAGGEAHLGDAPERLGGDGGRHLRVARAPLAEDDRHLLDPQARTRGPEGGLRPGTRSPPRRGRPGRSCATRRPGST